MAKNNERDGGLTLFGVLWRILAPLGLVLATYNPTGHSFYHWFSEALAAGEFGGVQFFLIVLLIIGWSILLVATWNALDTFGVILTGALLGAVVWMFIDWGVLQADSANVIAWIVLACLAGVLAVGLSWSHIWRRLTGQYAVDEIDG